MTDRTRQVADFLAQAGWQDAARQPLAGDASARRYERLDLAGQRAVLMDAPPEKGESTERFTRMDRWLAGHGYAAPAILAENHQLGLLLLEDFGDGVFARLVADAPPREPMLYAAATDFLIDLHRRAPPDFVPPLDAAALAGLLDVIADWYLPAIGQPVTDAAAALPGLVGDAYLQLGVGAQVTSLRDFHAENLIWLPERDGIARVGLLDFQDAVGAHPAYDLVSLLQDARRDVSPATETAMIARYTGARGLAAADFAAIYALLGAQRALRIIGVFARLALRDRRTRYLDFMPRVWGYLQRSLGHPALHEIMQAAREGLPAPDAAALQRMRTECTPIPGP